MHDSAIPLPPPGEKGVREADLQLWDDSGRYPNYPKYSHPGDWRWTFLFAGFYRTMGNCTSCCYYFFHNVFRRVSPVGELFPNTFAAVFVFCLVIQYYTKRFTRFSRNSCRPLLTSGSPPAIANCRSCSNDNFPASNSFPAPESNEAYRAALIFR